MKAIDKQINNIEATNANKLVNNSNDIKVITFYYVL